MFDSLASSILMSSELVTKDDIDEIKEKAIRQFGDSWSDDKLKYEWVHKNWSQTRDQPTPKNKWGERVKELTRRAWASLEASHPPVVLEGPSSSSSQPRESLTIPSHGGSGEQPIFDENTSITEGDVDELIQKALLAFGDSWHHDGNVSFRWVHENWSQTKDQPKPNKWKGHIRTLTTLVWASLEKSHPPIVSERHCDGEEQFDVDKTRIVRELMDTRWIFPDESAVSSVDAWVNSFHAAVAKSALASWVMKDPEKGVQSIGLATLDYGYRFKFRFEDDGEGELMYHGTKPCNVLGIIRQGFIPTVTQTLSRNLQDAYGVVPPLVWFSRKYSCASGYPGEWWVGQFATGEPLAPDGPPMRAIFRVRTKLSERLAHKKDGNNEQHAFAPRSVLRIVGLDLIATSMKVGSKRGFPVVHLGAYTDMGYLAERLNSMLGRQSRFADQPGNSYDPRNLHTKSLEEMERLAELIATRDLLLLEAKEIFDFHAKIRECEQKGELNALVMKVG